MLRPAPQLAGITSPSIAAARSSDRRAAALSLQHTWCIAQFQCSFTVRPPLRQPLQPKARWEVTTAVVGQSRSERREAAIPYRRNHYQCMLINGLWSFFGVRSQLENVETMLVKRLSVNSATFLVQPGKFRIGNTGGAIEDITMNKLYRKGSVCYVSSLEACQTS